MRHLLRSTLWHSILPPSFRRLARVFCCPLFNFQQGD